MRAGNILLGSATAGSVLALQIGTASNNSLTATNITVIPKRFIIEVAKGSSISELTAQLGSLNGTTIKKVFDSAVFSGVSVESADNNVDGLQSIAAAATVWPSRMITVEASTSQSLDNQAASPNYSAHGMTGVDNLHAAAAAATVWPSRMITVEALTSQSLANQAASPKYSIHGMTGVDKLHAAGIFGKGAQVAMIDTGVQYTHPALGGCLGAGCKVAGGYDFIGGGCWPLMGCPKDPDSDPMDTLFGTGTSLAGVIIATNRTNDFVGVAPEATIYSYKVFGSQGQTDEETVIEAFLMAYEDGADVISANSVGLGGFADNPLSVVASRMVDQGVVVTITAGNHASEGPFFTNAGASGNKVLAVAGVEANYRATPAFTATFNLNGESNNATVGYLAQRWPISFDRVGWPIIPLTMSTNVTNDACDTLPDDIPDYSRAVALVRLGGCDSFVKHTNLVAADVRAIIFYWDPSSIGDNALGGILPGAQTDTISDVAGEAIVNTWLAGGNVTGDFSLSNDYWVGIEDPQVGLPIGSNLGPLYDLSIKPDIAAPGGFIFSTTLSDDWSGHRGTQWASAYVAGIAALYIGQYGGRKTNPNFNATDLAMRIISSGSELPTGTGFVAPVSNVGAGLVNAFKVLNYTTQLSYTKFALNDTHNFERYQKVDIANNADVDVVYTFAALPAAGYEAWSNGSIVTQSDLTYVEMNPSITVPSGTFKVKAGSTRTAQINFDYPKYANTNLPVYSGLIQVNSTLGESFSVPYLGLATALSGFYKSQFPDGYPYIVSGLNSVSSADNSTWSFNLAVNKQDFPKLFLRTVFGSDEVRWDIFESSWVEKDWAYPPVTGQKQFVGSATYWSYSADALLYDPAESSIANSTIAFPEIAVERFPSDVSDSQFWWLGTLADGTTIAPGQYVMRVAALLPFGDRRKPAGWSTWIQSFTVV